VTRGGVTSFFINDRGEGVQSAETEVKIEIQSDCGSIPRISCVAEMTINANEKTIDVPSEM
jgi:hypothetical protein